MNALNRIVMLVVALLLIAAPAALLAVALGYLSPQTLDSYTGYRQAIDAVGGFSPADLGSTARTILGVAGAVIALLAFVLLLRELRPPLPAMGTLTTKNEPGQRIQMSAGAIRSLAEGALREAGAVSPQVRLRNHRGKYRLSCGVNAPGWRGWDDLAQRARENLERRLEEQGIQLEKLEITVLGKAREERRKVR